MQVVKSTGTEHALISSKKQKKHIKTDHLSVKCKERSYALPLPSK